MKNKKIPNKLILILFLPGGILLSYSLSFAPHLVENIYSTGIYKPMGSILSIITGIVPFSAAEFIIISIAVFVIWKLAAVIIKSNRKPYERKYIILDLLINIFISVSIIYFVFVIVWGINYNRLPFSQIVGLDTRPASVQELEEVCENIVENANRLRNKVNEDMNGIMKLQSSKTGMLERAYKGYDNALETYPELGGRYGRPKGVFFSNVMSYTGISGVYFPFTGEANVNMAIPYSMLPATACHEMAHQRGFAREDEANYIAYLTCSMHPDPDFQYSGTLLALIYATNALYNHDQTRYTEVYKNYSPGVRRDLAYINQFWKRYEGPVEEISNKINDTYLKANRQKEGVYSYGRMVDLLIAEYRSKTTKPSK